MLTPFWFTKLGFKVLGVYLYLVAYILSFHAYNENISSTSISSNTTSFV